MMPPQPCGWRTLPSLWYNIEHYRYCAQTPSLRRCPWVHKSVDFRAGKGSKMLTFRRFLVVFNEVAALLYITGKNLLSLVKTGIRSVTPSFVVINVVFLLLCLHRFQNLFDLTSAEVLETILAQCSGITFWIPNGVKNHLLQVPV